MVSVHENAVELDRTVFYPLGGGQAGDTGRLGTWRVLDTRKGATGDSVLHLLEPEQSLLRATRWKSRSTGNGATA